ncbi:alpha/beta hydrolase [Aliifodinibius sp. S!AR15-10]|uniref:alpha/beta hydrolase n=1 Tax=Aliifodinibius sp. S!AR15-10 TaxID=2950437 RepID=UPI0028571973|nr:alpha/beta fold hydrolase [Aliifodinibius sp. S!AR15-10]MDR8391535.1 alpha/beta hydrolase [Aliifodinibius sp. S!AR15-10]
MSLFRVDPKNPFSGPHQEIKEQTFGAPLSRAKAAMILVHGRGATAESMRPLAEEFAQPDFHYVTPQAANHTWYPYSFLEPKEKNQPGLSSGLQKVHDLLESIEEGGIPQNKIMILGFSQGGCLATEFAARHPARYGGVVGFSGGLIGPEIEFEEYHGEMEETPVFLGCSTVDPHIPKERVNETEQVLRSLGADVNKKLYPGMPHTVNEDEIKIIRGMMAKLLQQ